jgi:uncharacterized protein (TIGR02145 family)
MGNSYNDLIKMKKPNFALVVTILLTASLIISCKKDDSTPAKLNDIQIKTAPLKVSYCIGEPLDLSGLVVSLIMTDGEIKDIPFSDFADKGISCKPGNGTVVTAELTSVAIIHNETNQRINQTLTVSAVESITIKTPPKVSYCIPEVLDLSKLVVKLVFGNGNTKDVAFVDFNSWGIKTSPANGTALTTEQNSVTVTYTATAKSIIQPITISAVTGIAVKSSPSKVSYYVGEDLSLSGLIVTLSLENGDTREVTFGEFASRGIVTLPENGTELIEGLTDISITHSVSGKSTNQNITFSILSDIEGNTYKYRKIGNQIWMEENLKTTKYQNGDDIGTTIPATKNISQENQPKYQWAYDGDESNVTTYGRLYTQHVIMDNRNVCPAGWHVPSSVEFGDLIVYLISNGFNYDNSTNGNKVGKSLAAKTNWNSYPYSEGVPGNDFDTNNRSGFTGLPSGERIDFVQAFSGKGVHCYWWSSSKHDDGKGIALRIQNFQQQADVVIIGTINTGAPIRCLLSQ